MGKPAEKVKNNLLKTKYENQPEVGWLYPIPLEFKPQV
jgi:hypothetical protein